MAICYITILKTGNLSIRACKKTSNHKTAIKTGYSNSAALFCSKKPGANPRRLLTPKHYQQLFL